MANLLDRYRQGERDEVWAELRAYGPTIRSMPIMSEAWDVARETMTRARVNVERLVQRLEEIGYDFSHDYPAPPWAPPDDTASDEIAALEDLAGALPLSLKAWYEIVGSVCLMGTLPAWHVAGAHMYPDPLVVDPLQRVYTDFDDRLGNDDPEHLIIAPDEYHKEGVSGGPSYGIVVPDGGADGTMVYERHQTTFVNYLRICFGQGGFPGFERYETRPTEILTYLADDLLSL